MADRQGKKERKSCTQTLQRQGDVGLDTFKVGLSLLILTWGTEEPANLLARVGSKLPARNDKRMEENDEDDDEDFVGPEIYSPIWQSLLQSLLNAFAKNLTGSSRFWERSQK